MMFPRPLPQQLLRFYYFIMSANEFIPIVILLLNEVFSFIFRRVRGRVANASTEVVSDT